MSDKSYSQVNFLPVLDDTPHLKDVWIVVIGSTEGCVVSFKFVSFHHHGKEFSYLYDASLGGCLNQSSDGNKAISL